MTRQRLSIYAKVDFGLRLTAREYRTWKRDRSRWIKMARRIRKAQAR